MNTHATRRLPALAFLAAMPFLAACSVNVHKDEGTRKADVDIRTPLGTVSVHTDENAPTTGLAVHPGARPLRDDKDPPGANVNIDTALFGVKVAASKFEDDAPPQAIIDYYKGEMKTYGSVLECRGNIDFRGRSGAKQPRCKEGFFSRDVQLVVGTEDHHRIVVVKPRGAGSEFAVVHIQARVQG